MSEEPWNTQAQKAQDGLDPIRFLLGDWTGSGTCHGEKVEGRLAVQTRIDGTWIEAIETLLDPRGETIHTDVSLYRFDVKNENIEVIQLSEHAHRVISTVELFSDGFRWITGPGAPQLRFWIKDDSFRYSVTMPDDGAVMVEMAYTRS